MQPAGPLPSDFADEPLRRDPNCLADPGGKLLRWSHAELPVALGMITVRRPRRESTPSSGSVRSPTALLQASWNAAVISSIPVHRRNGERHAR